MKVNKNLMKQQSLKNIYSLCVQFTYSFLQACFRLFHDLNPIS